MPANPEPALGAPRPAASPGRRVAEVAAEMVEVQDTIDPGPRSDRFDDGIRAWWASWSGAAGCPRPRPHTPRAGGVRTGGADSGRNATMTQFVLVRHGETEWHAENRYAGISDVSLTARGLEQAKQLAAWAGTAGFAAVWTSTLTRAQLTAAPCADVSAYP